jgi:hypothetical protein
MDAPEKGIRPHERKKFPNNNFYIRFKQNRTTSIVFSQWWLIQGRQMIGGNKMENKTDDTSFYF